MAEKKKVTIYGDSVLRGVIYDPDMKKYRIGRNENIAALCEKHGLELDNKAKFGYSITDGEALIRYDIGKDMRYGAVVLEYGGNDCNFKWDEIAQTPDKEHIPKTPLHVFTQKLRELVTTFVSMGIKPLLVTLPPIDAERYLSFIVREGLSRENIVRWLGGEQMIYRYQEMYSLACAKLASELFVPLCDLRSAFLRSHRFGSLIGDDGLHPTREGQDLIIESFDAFLSSRCENLQRAY